MLHQVIFGNTTYKELKYDSQKRLIKYYEEDNLKKEYTCSGVDPNPSVVEIGKDINGLR